MNKTIIFDIKNTLVNDTGEWLEGAEEAIKLAKNQGCRVVLYSMNEPWTYGVLARRKRLLSTVEQILLVDRKQVKDLRPYRSDNKVLVVGDSVTEELAIAQALGYKSIAINGAVPVELIRAFIQGDKTSW